MPNNNPQGKNQHSIPPRESQPRAESKSNKPGGPNQYTESKQGSSK